MRSERINLLVTPEEKSFIDERARKAGISTSELVRQAVVSFDPEIDMDELRALSAQLATMVVETEKKLDANLADIAALRERLADEKALKAAAIAELKATGQEWPFDLSLRTRDAEAAGA
jgi:hypothetical protein